MSPTAHCAQRHARETPLRNATCRKGRQTQFRRPVDRLNRGEERSGSQRAGPRREQSVGTRFPRPCGFAPPGKTSAELSSVMMIAINEIWDCFTQDSRKLSDNEGGFDVD